MHVHIRTHANMHMHTLLLLFIHVFVSPTILPPILPTLCLHGDLRMQLTPCAPCYSFFILCTYCPSLFFREGMLFIAC